MYTKEWGEKDRRSVHNSGLWKEGNTIDKIDKMLSMLLFNLDLGFYFELFMSVPGMWFGAPWISTGLWPLLVAAVASG